MKSSRAFLAGLTFCLLLAACAATRPPDDSPRRYASVMNRYPEADGRLQLPRLSPASIQTLPAGTPRREVIIMVHPGYSFFFTLGKKTRYRGAKYRLMEHQFEAEAHFIASHAAQGRIVILIVPGNYEKDSTAPFAYASYLNSMTGPAVFSLLSETSSNGTISTADVVTLFHFLQSVRAKRVVIGGGYIGRCQREFHKQLTSYFDGDKVFILREASAISPQDVSHEKADRILSSLKQRDFSSVEDFMKDKLGDEVNIMKAPSAAAP